MFWEGGRKKKAKHQAMVDRLEQVGKDIEAPHSLYEGTVLYVDGNTCFNTDVHVCHGCDWSSRIMTESLPTETL